MKNNKLFISTFIFITSLAYSLFANEDDAQYLFPDESPSIISLVNWKTNIGDSAIWSSADYDDSDWKNGQGFGFWVDQGYPGKGIRWFRKRLFFPEPIDSLQMFALYQVAVVSASEIYWDGKLIARNGVVANNIDEEIPGVSGKMIVIPSGLVTQGSHIIAMRVSNFTTLSGIIEVPIKFGYLEKISGYLFHMQAVSLFLAGMFFLTAIVHFMIFIVRVNRWTYAIFSLFSLSCATYIIIRGYLRFFQIDLSNYYLLALLNDIPWLFMLVLLPIFFLYEFDSKYKKRLVGYVAGVALFIVIAPRFVVMGLLPIGWLNFFDNLNQFHFIVSIVLSMIVAIWAGTKRKTGSLTATAGLIVFLFGVMQSRFTGSENGWSVGFAGLNVFLVISLANQMAYRDRKHHRTELRATALKLDLLKKQIQPHFLLNSLNSIVAWLEEDPKIAARLVNSLAEELRLLMDFSKKRSITLGEEVVLCRAHLKIMGLRHERSYTLGTFEVNDKLIIPPLILHTLVENGLTHGYVGRDSGQFGLKCKRIDDTVMISLYNDSSVEDTQKVIVDGGGMKYVKARLEESFPGVWKIDSKPVKSGWLVELTIPYKVKG